MPQSTVLGPILFPLYVNSIGNCIRNEVVICYMDDTALMFFGKSGDEVKNKTGILSKEIKI